MKNGEKVDWLETSGSEEQHGAEFSGFSFCFIYSRLVVEETGSQEIPMAQTKQSSNNRKARCLLVQRQERATSEDRKLLDNNHSTSTKHHRKNRGLSPIHSTVEGLDLHPCEAMSGVKKKSYPLGCSRKGQVGSLDFHPYQAVMKPPQWRPCGELELPPPTQQEPPTSDVNRPR